MSEDSKSSVNNLIKSTEKLLKRFDEQKGIIDSYIKRERNWKRDKILHRQELSSLEKDLNKVRNE